MRKVYWVMIFAMLVFVACNKDTSTNDYQEDTSSKRAVLEPGSGLSEVGDFNFTIDSIVVYDIADGGIRLASHPIHKRITKDDLFLNGGVNLGDVYYEDRFGLTYLFFASGGHIIYADTQNYSIYTYSVTDGTVEYNGDIKPFGLYAEKLSDQQRLLYQNADAVAFTGSIYNSTITFCLSKQEVGSRAVYFSIGYSTVK